MESDRLSWPLSTRSKSNEFDNGISIVIIIIIYLCHD